MKHDHHGHCAHTQIKYCQKCDAAYCVNCSEEWPKYKYSWQRPYYATTTLPYVITNGNNINTTSTAENNPLHYQHS